MDADICSQIQQLAEETPTAQIAVWQDGAVSLALAFDASPVDVYAVQKGVLSLLFGIAEERFLLDLPDCMNHHLAPEWTRLSPWDEAKLTIEMLLDMVTGMDDELGPLGTIGETWRYNNTAYNYLKKILEGHMQTSLQEVSKAWLFDPLQMNDTSWQARSALLPDGTPFTGLHSTAADLLQVGTMLLDDDRLLVPQHFLQTLGEPGSADNPAWHRCWWNNRGEFYRRPMREADRIPGPAMPGLPEDAIAARGAFENILLVVPSMNLVLARTSVAGSSPAGFEQALWKILSPGSR